MKPKQIAALLKKSKKGYLVNTDKAFNGGFWATNQEFLVKLNGSQFQEVRESLGSPELEKGFCFRRVEKEWSHERETINLYPVLTANYQQEFTLTPFTYHYKDERSKMKKARLFVGSGKETRLVNDDWVSILGLDQGCKKFFSNDSLCIQVVEDGEVVALIMPIYNAPSSRDLEMIANIL